MEEEIGTIYQCPICCMQNVNLQYITDHVNNDHHFEG